MMQSSPEIFDWQKPTATQNLSDRSILRVQQLANEFRDQINELPLFIGASPPQRGKIANVSFVARDAKSSEEELGSRWYNSRLCAAFDFPPSVRKWFNLKYTDSNGQTNLDRMRGLFDAAATVPHQTAATFQAFVAALKGSRAGERKAYDLFITALALLPYRGLLPGMFDDVTMHRHDHVSPDIDCLWFEGQESEMQLWKCDGFLRQEQPLGPPSPQPEIRFKLQHASEYNLGLLFEHFINPFTRGEKKLLKENELVPPADSPYEKQENMLLSGFALPAYDHYDLSRGSARWQGGMAGWVLFFVNQPYCCTFPEGNGNAREISWRAFLKFFLVFVRRVREADIADLLLDYSERDPLQPVDKYFSLSINRVIGWKPTEAEGSCSLRLVLPLGNGQPDFVILLEPLWDTPHSTEIPTASQRLCKQFLDGLEMIYGRKGTLKSLDRISHELKHVANCLRNAWTIRPDDELTHHLQLFLNRKGMDGVDLSLCPYPDLIASASRTIELWTGLRDPCSLFPVMPRSLDEVMKGLWSTVTNVALALVASSLRFDKPTDLERFRRCRDGMAEAWNEGIIRIERNDESIDLPKRGDREATREKWLLVEKILLNKFTDALRHGSSARPRSVRVSLVETILSVSVANYRRDSVTEGASKNVAELNRALAAQNWFNSEQMGRGILESMLLQGGSFITCSQPGPRLGPDQMYEFDVDFHWNNPIRSSLL